LFDQEGQFPNNFKYTLTGLENKEKALKKLL